MRSECEIKNWTILTVKITSLCCLLSLVINIVQLSKDHLNRWSSVNVKSLHYLTSKWRETQGDMPRRTWPRVGGVGETGEERQERTGTGRESKKGKRLLFFYCLWSIQKHEATNIFQPQFNSCETSNKFLYARKRKFFLGLISVKLETFRGLLSYKWWMKCHDTFTRVSVLASLLEIRKRRRCGYP